MPSHGQRLYVDPCNYEDPEEALKEFAKELDKKWITLEKVIGGGMSGNYIFFRIGTTPENGTGNVVLHVLLSVHFDLSSQGSRHILNVQSTDIVWPRLPFCPDKLSVTPGQLDGFQIDK